MSYQLSVAFGNLGSEVFQEPLPISTPRAIDSSPHHALCSMPHQGWRATLFQVARQGFKWSLLLSNVTTMDPVILF